MRLHQLRACRIARSRQEGLGSEGSLPLNSQRVAFSISMGKRNIVPSMALTTIRAPVPAWLKTGFILWVSYINIGENLIKSRHLMCRMVSTGLANMRWEPNIYRPAVYTGQGAVSARPWWYCPSALCWCQVMTESLESWFLEQESQVFYHVDNELFQILCESVFL